MTKAAVVLDNKPLLGRVALVTGASRGLGASIARAYALAGAHVILLGRTQGALEEVDDQIQEAGGSATLFPFDLNETKKIPAIAPAIAEKFKRLDILVGNAGMLGSLSPIAHSEAHVFEEVMRVNFFANYHLIRTLDPLLRGSDAGRAIFVTAPAAHETTPFWGAYAASKAALERMVLAYAAEVAHSPLKVNLVEPGLLATHMRAAAFPAEDASQLPKPEDVAPIFVDLASAACTISGQRRQLGG